MTVYELIEILQNYNDHAEVWLDTGDLTACEAVIVRETDNHGAVVIQSYDYD